MSWLFVGRRLSNFLKIGAVGLGIMAVSSTIGPNGREALIVPEAREVVGIYSDREMEQINELRDDAYFVMLARVVGRNFEIKNALGRMLDNYSKMSPGVRGEVCSDFDDPLFYLENVFGKEIADDYRKRICEMSGER